jgi:hypothetical protein
MNPPLIGIIIEYIVKEKIFFIRSIIFPVLLQPTNIILNVSGPFLRQV